MQFDNSYFHDEIREGFYITGMVKRSWAMQMEVLDVIREICKKHNIKWYADCGTLLGAARHRGFIPWDDDLDICMFRDEYVRFNRIIEDELPKGYKVINLYNEPEYNVFLTRIVGNSEINMSNDFLNSHHGFPYAAGIDVFPLDYLYPNEDKEKARREKALAVWKVAQEYNDGKLNAYEAERLVFGLSSLKLDHNLDTARAFERVLDIIFSECDGKGSTKIAPMHDYIRSGVHWQEIAWYSDCLEIPFETTTINVPTEYEKLLSARYGDKWYIPVKNLAGHDYPYFLEQEKTLWEKKGSVPYIFDGKIDFDGLKAEREEHAKAVNPVKYYFNSFICAHSELKTVLENKAGSDSIISCLENSQNTAICLGNVIEDFYGEGTKTVAELENYCELIYGFYENAQSGCAAEAYNTNVLDVCVHSAEDNFYALTKEHHRILMVPGRITDWEYLKPLYEHYAKADDNEVYVMPAFYAWRGNDGSMENLQTDYSLFPKELLLVDSRQLDFSKNHFDEIVITNPYDEYQSGLSLHPYFYAVSLYKYADKLVYCQCFEVDQTGENDYSSLKNGKSYVITPGVLLADTIYVPNDNTREIYGWIAKANGEDTILSKNIEVLKKNADVSGKEKSTKKILLFNVTEGDLLSYGTVIKKIDTCLDIFRDTSDKLKILWTEEEGLQEVLEKHNPKIYEEYRHVREKFINMNIGSFIQLSAAVKMLDKVSGYYGSPGYLMNMCRYQKIPVMLWDKGKE